MRMDSLVNGGSRDAGASNRLSSVMYRLSDKSSSMSSAHMSGLNNVSGQKIDRVDPIKER